MGQRIRMPFCSLTDVRSPRLHDFVAYLTEKRGNRPGTLNRVEIDPVIEIPHLVGTILLIERIAPGQADAGRYRIRLVGSQLAAFAERDMTGRWLDEICPGRSDRT